MDAKRRKLFNDTVTILAAKRQILDFEKKYPNGYSDWVALNFKDEAAVKKACENANSLGVFVPKISEADFFKKFACDILVNSTYCTSTQTDMYACVKAVHTNSTTFAGTLMVKDGDTKTYNFFSNNRFLYKDGTKLLKGSWSCDGGDNYSVKLDNGQTYSSKNKVWSEIPAPEPDKSQQQPPKSEPDKPQPPKSEPDKSDIKSRAVIIQKGQNNFRVSGSDAIIY